MKRSIASLIVTGIAGVLMAQAPFTIVSPRNYNPDSNGPLSRENVVLKFPKASVLPNSYIGIFIGKTRGDQAIDEKFVEAAVPKIVGDYAVYTLDTKGRKFADDLYTVRAVLYVDYSDRPREINQSQVNIRIANQSSIKIPEDGLKLRYGFSRGKQWIYNVEIKTSISTISANLNSLGGRPAELPMEGEKLRILYAIDDAYSNGDGLIRMQALPEKGKDYAYILVSGATTAQKYYSYEMAPVYLRVTSTGNEVFGAIPSAVPTTDMGSFMAASSRVDLFGNLPLPTLPVKAVKPSDSWQSRFLMGKLDLEKKDEMQSFTSKVPARGEFVGVEYEGGHPCAKLRHTISQGSATKEGIELQNKQRAFGDDKVSLDETIWFALDTKAVIKIVRDITIDTKDASGTGFGTNQGTSGPGGPGGPPVPGPGGPGGRGGNGGGSKDDFSGLRLQKGAMGGPPRPGAAGGPPPGFNGGFQGGRGSNQSGSQAQYFRIHEQMIWTLEK